MIQNNVYSGRSILQSLGVGEVQATLALQQIQLSPRESDPDAGATIVIVKAAQRAANQLGCRVEENGRLDHATVSCIRRAVGPHWESLSWLEITKALIMLRYSGMKIAPPDSPPLAVGAVDFGTKVKGLLILGGLTYLAIKLHK